MTDGAEASRLVGVHSHALSPPALPLVDVGIMRAFALHVEDPRASLVVAGPAIEAVADDPEAGAVLSEAQAAWRRLPPHDELASGSPRSRWTSSRRTP